MAPPSVIVREYKDNKAYQKEAQRLSSQGYIVTTTTEKTRRSGCLRTLTFGLFFPPKTTMIVTYTKQQT